MITILRNYFISGLLFWLPLWVTFLVIDFLINLFNRSLTLLPRELQPEMIFGFHIPGAGVIITLLIIFLTGVLVANFIGRRLVEIGDAILERIPLVRTVYTGVKQVTETLFTPGGQSFRKVLLVEYPCAGSWTIAFQTGEVSPDIESAINSQSMVSYYVPTTPNPTSGFFLMRPKSEVIELKMSVDQALKLVISLGVVQPGSGPVKKTKNKIEKKA